MFLKFSVRTFWLYKNVSQSLCSSLSLSLLDSSPSHFFSDDHRTTSPEHLLISSADASPHTVNHLIFICLFVYINFSPNKQNMIAGFCCCWKVLQLQLNCVLSSVDRFRITVCLIGVLEFEICCLVGPRMKNCAIGSVLDSEIHGWEGFCCVFSLCEGYYNAFSLGSW